MMLKKTIVAGIVVVLMLCAVQAASEDSDATVTERALNHVYFAEVSYQPNQNWGTGCMAFIPDSENQRAMEAFLKDPYHADIPLTDDEKQIKSSNTAIQKVYLYNTSSFLYYSYTEDGNYMSKVVDGTKVLDESRISFFVKSGDEIKIELHNIVGYPTSMDGSTQDGVYIYNGISSTQYDSGDTYENTYGINSVVSIAPKGNCIAADITYDASGYVLPNGSSTAFMIAAIVIAATILAILIMCGIRPRWST